MTTVSRVALVTGGNRGLGLETARQIAAHGLRVLLGSRNLQAGTETARALDRAEVQPVRLDITSTDDVAACVPRTD